MVGRAFGADTLRRAGESWSAWLAPALIVLAILIIGGTQLDQYNPTWDEALGDYFFGERYWSFFTTGDSVYLDFEANPYPSDRVPDLGASRYRTRPHEYYPVVNTLAAGLSELLSRRLGLMDAFDGYHAINLFFGALLVAVFYPFLRNSFGTLTAIAGTTLLLTCPRVFCHMLANIKDFPSMVLYAVVLIAFLRAYQRGSAGAVLMCGVPLGLALATKGNALFIPVTLVTMKFFGELPICWERRRAELALALLGAGVLSIVVMVALWPYLWPDPIDRFGEHLEYIAFRSDFMRSESFAPVFGAIFFTTPPVVLLLAALGVVPALRRARDGELPAQLLFAWSTVVLGRFALPGAVNFDGIRHFLELFPALAAFAGLGAAEVATRVATKLPLQGGTRGLRVLLIAALLIPSTWATLRHHPFQIAYWNAFAGGYEGARERDLPQASDYWGLSYRLGLQWLNDNAPPNSLLAVPVVEHAVRLVAPLRLRSDIRLAHLSAPGSPVIHPENLAGLRAAAQRGPAFVMFVERRDWMNALMRECLDRLEPVAEWKLDGAPVLQIYRYTPPSDPPAPTSGRTSLRPGRTSMRPGRTSLRLGRTS